jgi:uncharacterized protein (DUF58 family)
MILTRRFWLFCALGIPIAALSLQLGVPIVTIAYDGFLVLAAYLSTRLVPSSDSLKVSRKFDAVLSVRAWNKIKVLVENEGIEAVDILFRDEPPAPFEGPRKEFRLKIPPGESKEVEYSIRPLERGADSFQGSFVRFRCPFGLAYKQVRIATEQPVRIYPNILALKEFDLLRQRGRLKEIGIRRARLRGLGSDFESLRQYTDGDDFRKIDWKATARKGELVVRQFEQERNQVVIVCIDIGRQMLSEVDGVRKLDHVLDSLLMLAKAAALAGDLIGLLVFSDTVRRFLPPRKGHSQVALFIEACHDLVAEPLESDFPAAMAYLSSRWSRRCLLIMFTDCDEPERTNTVIRSFLPVARRHLALFCRISDPRIEALTNRQTETVKDMYGKASANLLTKERKDSLSILSSAGAHVLDSEPQDLAANLVNFYFMVKERSLI